MFRLLIVAFLVAVLSVITLGQEPPAVPDAPTLRDENIRIRSIDLERTRRDANKVDEADRVEPHKDLNARFPEIKKDYEGLQWSRAQVKDSLTDSDMKKLRKVADKVTKQAASLHKNLFVDKLEKKPKDEPKKEVEMSLKSMVKELDTAIVAFTRAKMFANISVIKPEDAAEGHKKLMRIYFLSKDISAAAKIQEKANK